MESELVQLIVVFIVGLVSGGLLMMLWNKLSSGSASPAGLKQEYEQYQDLYKHLSVGATSLCRPDSVAATLADESARPLKLEAASKAPSTNKKTEPEATKPKADTVGRKNDAAKSDVAKETGTIEGDEKKRGASNPSQ